MVKKITKKKPFWLALSAKWWTLLVILLVVVIVLALEYGGVTHFWHTQEAVSGTIPSKTLSTPSESESSEAKSSSAAPNPQAATPPSAKTPDASPQSSDKLISPYGNFVSNHYPNLSGSPAPSSEQSSCVTSPGAVCHIEFFKDGITKKLDPQIVDGTGSAIWAWDIKTAGLTEGQWQITAVATFNGQSLSVKDPKALEVAQ